MKYSDTINDSLNYYRDVTLWRYNQHAQELLDYRSGLMNSWDDSVSKEINMKYLNPHENDQVEMCEHLEQQKEYSQNLASELDVIATLNRQITLLGTKIERLLTDCEDDLRGSIVNFDLANETKSTADQVIPNVSAMLNKANRDEFYTD